MIGHKLRLDPDQILFKSPLRKRSTNKITVKITVKSLLVIC